MSEHSTHTKFGQIIKYLEKYQWILHVSIVIIILFIDFQFLNPILPIYDINLIVISIALITYLSVYLKKLIIKKQQKNQPHIICPACYSEMQTLGAWKCKKCPGIFDPYDKLSAIKNTNNSSNNQSPKMVEITIMLKKRLAKGEIDKEEFFKLKKIIHEN